MAGHLKQDLICVRETVEEKEDMNKKEVKKETLFPSQSKLLLP